MIHVYNKHTHKAGMQAGPATHGSKQPALSFQKTAGGKPHLCPQLARQVDKVPALGGVDVGAVDDDVAPCRQVRACRLRGWDRTAPRGLVVGQEGDKAHVPFAWELPSGKWPGAQVCNSKNPVARCQAHLETLVLAAALALADRVLQAARIGGETFFSATLPTRTARTGSLVDWNV